MSTFLLSYFLTLYTLFSRILGIIGKMLGTLLFSSIICIEKRKMEKTGTFPKK